MAFGQKKTPNYTKYTVQSIDIQKGLTLIYMYYPFEMQVKNTPNISAHLLSLLFGIGENGNIVQQILYQNSLTQKFFFITILKMGLFGYK
jgi:hypothetical protein